LSPESPDDTQLPSGWKLPQLARLVSKLTNGFVGPTRDILVPAGVRYLQSLHIKSGQIDFGRGEYYVEQDWSNAHAKSVLQAGDVLIVQTGDIGQTAVVTEEFVGCNCHALIIATPRRELVVPEYLELVLRSAYGRAAFDLYATGALHPHLNCTNIRDIRIPVPPVPLQREIATACLRVQEAHRDLRSHVLQHIERLREYRSSLISAAVTGQLSLN
jgi:type I restriction enzyme S subunit